MAPLAAEPDVESATMSHCHASEVASRLESRGHVLLILVPASDVTTTGRSITEPAAQHVRVHREIALRHLQDRLRGQCILGDVWASALRGRRERPLEHEATIQHVHDTLSDAPPLRLAHKLVNDEQVPAREGFSDAVGEMDIPQVVVVSLLVKLDDRGGLAGRRIDPVADLQPSVSAPPIHRQHGSAVGYSFPRSLAQAPHGPVVDP